MGAINKSCTILLVAITALLTIMPANSLIPRENAATTFEAQYSFFDQSLFVSVPPSLYVYYNNLSHVIKNDSYYAQFITPQTVQSIADSIFNLTQDLPYSEEQFANKVLDFVHQIPYNITGAKYPVETLIENQGDCGALSLLAASIMKAGGLDVVLIKYTATDFAHMNVGVNLPHDPVYKNLFFAATNVQHGNQTYWTAEATPKADWKVGDQPASMTNTLTEIIPIENSEQNSPGQVSCSLSPLTPSSISINFSSKPQDAQTNRSLLIYGTTEPNIPQNPITIYVNKDNRIAFDKTITDAAGNFAFLWNFTADGTYYITASCSGNETFAGADSKPVAVLIGPPSPLQFQTELYNYVVGIGISDIAIRPYMGVKEFLDTPVEVNASFSYSFSVLSTGQSTSDIKTKNITLPATEHTIRARNRSVQVIQVPAKTLVVPESIPPGLQPLVLPDDFNQTINNQFCFVIQTGTEGNYTFTAQGLNAYEIEALKPTKLSSVFFNVTDGISESEWYTVKTELSTDGISVGIQNEQGVLIQSLCEPLSLDSNKTFVLMVTNNADSAVVLKDFQVHDASATVEPTSQIVHLPAPPAKSLLLFCIAVVIIAAVLIITAAAINVKRVRNGI